jgi:Beta-lactamase
MNDSAVKVTDILRTLGISEAALQTHVFRPDHVAEAAVRIELHRTADGDRDVVDPPPSGTFYRLNVEKLGRDLHALLSGCLVGYSLQLRRFGRPVLDQQWNWAQTPTDDYVWWTSAVKMHVASVSKLITAMALTKLLDSRGISPDAPIAPWLPAYWHRGPGVERITFRRLLTHTSGLVVLDEKQPGPSDFQFMKDQIAIGAIGKPAYRNVNYGLCRILIAAIDGAIPFTLFSAGLTDAFWDITTIRAYARYVQENVFDPVGVTAAFTHGSGDALAYPFPATTPGWNSGDLSTMSGCAAWHLSVDDLLAVMAAFRRRGLIVDPVVAQTMLDRQFGLDVKRDTPLGRIYAKGGFWSFKDGTFVEQSNVFFLPKGMELAILANSSLCTPDTGFMGRVLEAIEANIENTLLTATVTAIGVLAAVGLIGRATARRR